MRPYCPADGIFLIAMANYKLSYKKPYVQGEVVR